MDPHIQRVPDDYHTPILSRLTEGVEGRRWELVSRVCQNKVRYGARRSQLPYYYWL